MLNSSSSQGVRREGTEFLVFHTGWMAVVYLHDRFRLFLHSILVHRVRGQSLGHGIPTLRIPP